MKTTLLDDAVAATASNDKPALASVFRRLAAVAKDFGARTYPIATFAGGNRNFSEDPATPMLRRIWFPGSVGPTAIGGQALIVPIADTTGVPDTGLDLNHSDADQSFTLKVPQTSSIRENINDRSDLLYPKYAVTAPLFTGHVADHTAPATARELIIQSGLSSGPAYGPQIRAGSVWVRQNRNPTPEETFPLTEIAAGGEITAEHVGALRDYVIRLWLEKGIQFGWTLCKNNTGTYGVALSGGNYRYFHDPTVGQGGTAPSVTGPGINIPAACTGRGRALTVRCYLRVYARMTGSSDPGNIGVYNRNGVGGMAGPTALTHGASITGTTWRWYPSTNFDPSADPYFLLNANPVWLYDHVLPCGRRTSGSTDSMMVGAYSMYVMPSNA